MKTKKPNRIKKPQLDPRIEGLYETYIEYDCPIRGKVKQKVLVKKFKDVTSDVKPLVKATDGVSDIENNDDGLSLYADDQETDS